jgi:SAM-dependent methyltransferase
VPAATLPGVTDHEWLDATRTAYDTVATDYADLLERELAASPWDRAMLRGFADLVSDAGGGSVLEVGCGPGRVAAHLHALGLDTAGMDLSPQMVAVARRRHPGLRFSVGSMLHLDEPDAALAGLVAWYSIIHVPPADLAAAFTEFGRALRPEGRLLLAFQVGDERRHITQAYGHTLSLHSYRRPPERVVATAQAAGFVEEVRTVRAPTGPETVPQAYLLLRRVT